MAEFTDLPAECYGNYSASDFHVIHKVDNVGIFVLLPTEIN